MAARLVVDTSSWIPFLDGRGWPRLSEFLISLRVRLPPLVAAELLSDRLSAGERDRLIAFLRQIALCDATLAHWVRVGALRSSLRAVGISVSIPDTHVAQCALDLDAELLTEDGIFRLVAKHTRLRLVADA